MATTTNYGWTKPTVGGDSNAWGTEINTDLDGIDTTVKAVSDVANAALPKAGGTITGNLTVNGTLTGTLTGNITGNAPTATALTSGSKSITGNLTVSGTVAAGGTLLPNSTDLANALGFDGAGNPYWETANGAGIIYQRSTNKYLFQFGGSTIASIDSSGNMVLKGSLTQNGTP